jgi:hypothetical protein
MSEPKINNFLLNQVESNLQQPGTNSVMCLRTMIAQSSDNDLHSQYLYRNNVCTLFKGHLMWGNVCSRIF